MATYPKYANSYGTTEQRLAAIRRRSKRQKRFVLVFILFGILLPLAITQVRRNAPPAPLLVITWPKPKIRQVMASGSTVLVRQGSPFEVTVSEPEHWKGQWESGRAACG